MDIREQVLNCDKCGQEHKIKIDFSKLSKMQLQGREPVLDNFICPNIYLMYRIMNFNIDTRVNALKSYRKLGLKNQEISIINEFKAEWGELNFDAKLNRFMSLDLAFIGMPEEYYDLLIPVVTTYYCGYFYPAMTSAGALGERILNRLIIKMRDHYKSSKHYKKIWKKKSFEQWDFPVKVLKDWGVISLKVARLFLDLKQYRNDSIHYNGDYDFETNSHEAIRILAEIINIQFNYITRTDLFWVFDVPGEILLRSSVVDNPFVIEFILPHCIRIGPFCEPTASPPVKTSKYPLKPFSDKEFIELRKNK
jgi:hypothetical protein